ncbi:MAG: hypothetical protein KH031_09690 [Clostridiales bacterium]|nr:hypothetical protein [Clostridiales bacterium]
MTPYYETKIGKIIAQEFDSRMEAAIFSYILEHGFNQLKEVADIQIEDIKSSSKLMTDDFCRAMVKAAVRICKECTVWEYMTDIRCYLNIEPKIDQITLYKDDYSERTWSNLLQTFNVEEEKEYINMQTIVEVD